MPTCSVIASGFSLWMPLDDGFQDSIWNVAVLMASIQKDMLLIRVALVPIVHPIIVYTPTTKARNLSKFTNEIKNIMSGKANFGLKRMSVNALLRYDFSGFVKLLAWILAMTIRFFFFSAHRVIWILISSTFWIRRRGKSQAAIRLIVLLNRSVITIKPRLSPGTKYSRGVSLKERLKERNPKENGIKPLTSLLSV